MYAKCMQNVCKMYAKCKEIVSRIDAAGCRTENLLKGTISLSQCVINTNIGKNFFAVKTLIGLNLAVFCCISAAAAQSSKP
jgi:hypothetical protein